jgi:hypothetical protein
MKQQQGIRERERELEIQEMGIEREAAEAWRWKTKSLRSVLPPSVLLAPALLWCPTATCWAASSLP